jgi:hypothetical protein
MDTKKPTLTLIDVETILGSFAVATETGRIYHTFVAFEERDDDSWSPIGSESFDGSYVDHALYLLVIDCIYRLLPPRDVL